MKSIFSVKKCAIKKGSKIGLGREIFFDNHFYFEATIPTVHFMYKPALQGGCTGGSLAPRLFGFGLLLHPQTLVSQPY